jgi:uncharacterized membrane protein required for colicin V production
MSIDLNSILRVIYQPAVIADIVVVLFCVLILLRNFNRGFINVLLKGTACYLSAISVMPAAMGFLAPSTNTTTAFIGAIVLFLVVAFVLNNLIDKLTPHGAYSVLDNLLGLVFGLVEIAMLLFVVSGCQVYLEKQNMQLPWTKGFDHKNLTGTLLAAVKPYSAKYIEQLSDNQNLHSLQLKIQESLKIRPYFTSAPKEELSKS